jgi:hypothetical protein
MRFSAAGSRGYLGNGVPPSPERPPAPSAILRQLMTSTLVIRNACLLLLFLLMCFSTSPENRERACDFLVDRTAVLTRPDPRGTMWSLLSPKVKSLMSAEMRTTVCDPALFYNARTP